MGRNRFELYHRPAICLGTSTLVRACDRLSILAKSSVGRLNTQEGKAVILRVHKRPENQPAGYPGIPLNMSCPLFSGPIVLLRIPMCQAELQAYKYAHIPLRLAVH